MPVIKDAYIPDAKRVTQLNVQNADEVKKMTEGIKAVNEVRNVAGALSGIDSVQAELKHKEEKMDQLEKEKNKIAGELQDTKMEVIQKELGGKIEQLSQDIKSGAPQKTISDQISDIKTAAGQLGLGTSKVSEFKEMAALIQSLSPQQKGLAEQVKEAMGLLATLHPEKEKEDIPVGVPAGVALELKRMDTNLQITLEEMKDKRLRDDQNFQITMEKWKEERDSRRQEVEGKLAVERERNELLAGGLDRLGRVIAQAGSEPGAPSQHQGSRAIQAGVGEFGEATCPKCQTIMPIARDAVKAVCPGCGTPYNINRIKREIPAEQAQEAEQSESELAQETEHEFAD